MKKAIMLFCLAISLFTTNAFAQLQEVRGVETRRVVYDGPSYDRCPFCSQTKYSTQYYGFEFHNHNSIKVSVDIELWLQYRGNKTKEATKTIVLEPNETYVFKQEERGAFQKDRTHDHETIDNYYIEYKAYKLQ